MSEILIRVAAIAVLIAVLAPVCFVFVTAMDAFAGSFNRPRK